MLFCGWESSVAEAQDVAIKLLMIVTMGSFSFYHLVLMATVKMEFVAFTLLLSYRLKTYSLNPETESTTLADITNVMNPTASITLKTNVVGVCVCVCVCVCCG